MNFRMAEQVMRASTSNLVKPERANEGDGITEGDALVLPVLQPREEAPRSHSCDAMKQV